MTSKTNTQLVGILLTVMLAGSIQAAEWKNLFNGSDLDGWKQLGGDATYKVEVCSITGKVVHTETFSGMEVPALDLSGLSDGIYLIRLSENEKTSGAVKLIIK